MVRNSVFSDSVYEQKYKEYLESLGDLPYDVSEPENTYLESGRYGDFELVGHGPKTNQNCGRFFGYTGCVRTELHDLNRLDGQNFKGKVYVRIAHHSCNNPRCPVCYAFGWASREADKAEQRFNEASKRFGLPEHMAVNVPDCDFGLDFDSLRSKVAKILYARGVIGGCLIFHGFRYRHSEFIHGGIRHMRGWYWSPHFHCVGFILGGYGKCRHCHDYAKKGYLACAGCNGFEARTRRLWEKDKYIVKVMGLRKTVHGTVWYALNHSSVKTNVKRFHVCTWFGNMSYRKLEVTYEKRQELCPICQYECEHLRYFGSKKFVLDKNAPGYTPRFYADMNEGMGEVWAVKGQHDYG